MVSGDNDDLDVMTARLAGIRRRIEGLPPDDVNAQVAWRKYRAAVALLDDIRTHLESDAAAG